MLNDSIRTDHIEHSSIHDVSQLVLIRLPVLIHLSPLRSFQRNILWVVSRDVQSPVAVTYRSLDSYHLPRKACVLCYLDHNWVLR